MSGSFEIILHHTAWSRFDECVHVFIRFNDCAQGKSRLITGILSQRLTEGSSSRGLVV